MKLTFALLVCTLATATADPQLSAWFTANSSKYARIVETDAQLTADTTETTWTRTSGPNTFAQTLPVYGGPQQIDYSANWIYLKTPDLGTYTMGPWYDTAARTALFVNLCKNQNLTLRIPRTASLGVIPTTKTGTMGLQIGGVLQDAVGWYVDGVAIFDPMDGYSYAGGTESSPGTGSWHRDAYVNEAITFDKSYAHQQNTGKYHNHANPFGLRYQLGDNVNFNPTTKAYTEGNVAAPAKHSPVIGWMLDGLPLYGPYGYSSALDATSGVRRMVGGFVIRNGLTTGVDNISTAGRALPTWATRNGSTAASGPAVSTTYPLGRYIEDWAYLGDLVKTGTTKYAQGPDFDLNEYNVRYCVTPEFPNGTWAYFANVSTSGLPQFPYLINRFFYGTPTGGTLTTVAETVTNYFTGGAGLTEQAKISSVNNATGAVNLTWTSVEGGSYKVEASNDLSSWTTLTSTQAATAASTTTNYAENAGASTSRRFYKVARSALALYDGGGGITYTAPTVATTAASSVGSSTAALNGTVNANGQSTTISFEYGLTTSYGSTGTASPATLATSAVTNITAPITGLTPTTTYHFRIKAVNNLGTSYGSDLSLTTTAIGAQLAPTVTPTAASALATTTASINGTVNANGASTGVTFEYGLTASYGSTATASPATVSGNTATAVTTALTGLTASTTYHFRVKAVNTGGTSYGADTSFTTTTATTQGIASVSPNTGTHGAINVTLTITLNSAYSPSPPPTTVAPTAVTLTGPTTVNATSFSRNGTTGVVTATFNLPAVVGSYTVNATFGPNTWSLANGFTVQ